ncbi:uncharacterized protein [Gossypium hirsutum]|uniref:Retrovirus-related Pol polyprotein from transposon TNT 1-94 n=1 Tax=Gossypium hirsutum TaxID=3635 RepID=A0ABM2ZQ49_GOSHI|nr:uncharacterized protein LOC107907907 [Gossypium hirsutum]
MASENFVQSAIPRFDGHYDHWNMLMENFLRSKEHWQVVLDDILETARGTVVSDAQRAEIKALKLKDLKAKNFLFQAIDRSILETILCKDTFKQIWDFMKKKYQGIAKAKLAQLQALHAEFKTLHMNAGESVTDYFAKTMAIANKMRIHGERLENVTIIEKILRSMTTKFNSIVCSIKESNDIDKLSIDELQGSLLIHEQKLNRQDKEEQVLQVLSNNHSFFSKGGGRGRVRGRGNNTSNGGHSHRKYEDNQFSYSQGRGRGHDNNNSTLFMSKFVDKSKVEYYRCHRFGHYKSECRTNLNRDGGK